MVHLPVVEVGTMIVAQEYVIELLVIQITHHLASKLLSLRSGSILNLLFNLFLKDSLLIHECPVFVGSGVNTVVPIPRLLRRRFLGIYVFFEADASSSTIIHHHLAGEIQHALVPFPSVGVVHVGHVGEVGILIEPGISSNGRALFLTGSALLALATVSSIFFVEALTRHQSLESCVLKLGIPHKIPLNLLNRILHLLVFLHDLKEFLLEGTLLQLDVSSGVFMIMQLFLFDFTSLLLHDLHSTLNIKILSLQLVE